MPIEIYYVLIICMLIIVTLMLIYPPVHIITEIIRDDGLEKKSEQELDEIIANPDSFKLSENMMFSDEVSVFRMGDMTVEAAIYPSADEIMIDGQWHKIEGRR